MSPTLRHPGPPGGDQLGCGQHRRRAAQRPDVRHDRSPVGPILSTWIPGSTRGSLVTFADFLATLWRRRLTIAISAVVAVVAALGYTKLRTRRPISPRR